MHATSKMDCTHYETAMNKESLIEKLYFMLSRLVNEGSHVVKGGGCCVCASFVLIQCYAKASSHPPISLYFARKIGNVYKWVQEVIEKCVNIT